MGVTSESLSRKVTWPFMTIPHLEVRGTRLNELSHNLMVAFSPLVAPDEREEWEAYAQDMQGWIQEGLDYDTEWITADKRSRRQLSDAVTNISTTIHRGSLDSAKEDPNPARFPEEGPGPCKQNSVLSFCHFVLYLLLSTSDSPIWSHAFYVLSIAHTDLPVWQLVPAPHNPSVVNYNLLSHEIFDRLYHFVNQTKSPIISEVFDLEFLYGGSIHEDPTHPFSVLMQPIFEDFQKDSRLVGVLTAVLPWDHYLEKILPKGVNVIVVVMEDTCGDSMTYAVTGPEAEFIGYGVRQVTGAAREILRHRSNHKCADSSILPVSLVPSTHTHTHRISMTPSTMTCKDRLCFRSFPTIFRVNTSIASIPCIFIQPNLWNKIIGRCIQSSMPVWCFSSLSLPPWSFACTIYMSLRDKTRSCWRPPRAMPW